MQPGPAKSPTCNVEVAEAEDPWTVSKEAGTEEPIPTFPVARIVKSWTLVEEATTKGGMFPAIPVTAKLATGVVLPIPTVSYTHLTLPTNSLV